MATAELAIVVQVVCAWCRQPISGREPGPFPPGARLVVSHGTCPACASLSFDQRDALAALACEGPHVPAGD